MMAKQMPMGSHGLHWDPIGTATLCTLIDTDLCKPDDGQTSANGIPWFTLGSHRYSNIMYLD